MQAHALRCPNMSPQPTQIVLPMRVKYTLRTIHGHSARNGNIILDKQADNYMVVIRCMVLEKGKKTFLISVVLTAV